MAEARLRRAPRQRFRERGANRLEERNLIGEMVIDHFFEAPGPAGDRNP
jgi:hypothetical protein